MAKVVHLQPTTTLRTPISHAIRTGEASYRRLEDLHAEGRLPARAVVELRGVERLARDLVHLNVDDGRLNKALSDWRKRIDSMTRMFETLSERPRPSPPPLKRRQGPGAPTYRSSA